jgi:signal transduction histidine kinase
VLRSLKLRTKLTLIVVIPVIAALVVAVPGFRSRRQELNRVENAQALLTPVTTVSDFLTRLQDEGSLSAWWVASADPAVKERLASARVETDRAARQLTRAADAAADHGAPVAANRIRALRESVALMSQERQFVDLRIAPDDSVLGYYRELGSETTGAIDAFVRAPREAVAVTMFRDLATLARLGTGIADERSILAVGYSRLRLTDPQVTDLVAAVTLQRASSDALLGQGRASTRTIVTDGMRDFSEATDQVKQSRATALTTRLLAPDVTPAEWYGSATRQLVGWGTIDNQLRRDIATDLRTREDDARNALVYYAIGALAVLLLAGGLAVVVARSIRRPLRQMADNANDVATQQLPALVDALNDETVVPPTITPLVVRSRDEVGALAKAFNHVERTTVEVAELQRQAVRSGISDLYVNLARRNQPLLSRQLALIEDLEREERDPDRLGTLFTLDHLATRMRRNSDSLLVLAGQDDLLTNPTPVALLDVVRGAVSETAEFGRIDTAGIPREVEVVGYAAPDLAHAVSELLENATSFSPPASRVVVAARRVATGIELTITDEGIGIAAPRVDAINQTLAKPPLPGLAMSHSLGLIVVARLAHRIGVQVTLRSAPEVGTAAVLQLPDSILRSTGDPLPDVAPPPSTADIDLTVDADGGEVPAAPASPPWTRPGVRPADPLVPTATGVDVDPAAETETDEEIDLLPRRGRHHRRRRPHRGAGEPAGGSAEGPEAVAPLMPPPIADAAPPPTDVGVAAGSSPDQVPPPPPPLGPAATDDGEPVTLAGLPRRTPHPAAPAREPNLAAPPPARPPDAVFELVARYEAGRRRAGTRPTEPTTEEQE